jgi:hypothetical protein
VRRRGTGGLPSRQLLECGLACDRSLRQTTEIPLCFSGVRLTYIRGMSPRWDLSLASASRGAIFKRCLVVDAQVQDVHLALLAGVLPGEA